MLKTATGEDGTHTIGTDSWQLDPEHNGPIVTHVIFHGVGEVTANKELVSQQQGPWKWDVDSPRFKQFLDFANETGLGVILHNDGGRHGLNPAGRPEARKIAYENYSRMIDVLGQRDREGRLRYPDLNIQIAHTNLGRFARPDNTPRTDWVNIVGPDGAVVQRKQITAAEHTHRLYELLEKVPQAKIDLSWNDVKQGYVHDPGLLRGMIRLMKDYPDRFIDGSDTVKPVNSGHYNQSTTTGSPLIAELALRNPEAAWKFMRGNFEDLTNNARARVLEWTRQELEKQGRIDDIAAMDRREAVLRGHREAMTQGARKEFRGWLDQLHRNVQEGLLPEPGTFRPDGVYTALYDTLGGPEVQTWHERARSRVGLGTGGGEANELVARHAGAGAAAAGLSAGAVAAGEFGVNHPGVFDPRHSPLPEIHNWGSVANPVAYTARGAMITGRTMHAEAQRLGIESILEEGHLTRDSLNKFVSRLVSARMWLNLSDQQLTRIGAATEQLWANYNHLRETPLDPAPGWTEQHRFLALMGAIGDYQIIVDRELGFQASSVSALDARAPLGQLMRAGILGTFLINDAATAAWLANGPIDLNTWAGKADFLSRSAFGLANAVLTAHAAGQLGAGRAKVNWESSRPMQAMQAIGNSIITGGGAAWTARDFLYGLAEAGARNPGESIWNFANAALDAAFTAYMARSSRNEISKVSGRGMEGPSKLEKPAILLGSFLVARELSALLAQFFGQDN